MKLVDWLSLVVVAFFSGLTYDSDDFFMENLSTHMVSLGQQEFIMLIIKRGTSLMITNWSQLALL